MKIQKLESIMQNFEFFRRIPHRPLVQINLNS